MADQQKDQNGTKVPIYVDLDGTLINTDILVESALILLKKNLLYAALFIVWLFKGKAHLKHEIAKRVSIDVSTLPYNDELLKYLKRENKRGTLLYLATASNKKFAMQISDHLGIFEGVIASDEQVNMSGASKLKAIKKDNNENPFIYAGNSNDDVPIWNAADGCIIANAGNKLERSIAKKANVLLVCKQPGKKIFRWLKAIRIHQWLKNILLFVSLLAAHKLSDLQLLFQAFLGFLAFCFCASSVYLLNDLFDLTSDRRHPTKKNRPFAAGTLKPISGLLVAPFLLGLGIVSCAFLPVGFLYTLTIYYIFTWIYSLYLKKLALMDVMALTCLYVIRVVAGSTATGVSLSFWLAGFSLFLFFSLALVKRASELNTLKSLNKEEAAGRGYLVSDLQHLHSMGLSSGYIATLIIALYINSEKVISLYKTPEILWLTFPLVLYWISRIWLKTWRGEVPDDPLLYAFKDTQSLLIGCAFVSVMAAATFLSIK